MILLFFNYKKGLPNIMSKTIHSFTVDNESATELQWVLSGTSGDSHQSFVFIETQENSQKVEISNNRFDGYRMISLSNNLSNDAASDSVCIAVRAKAISPFIPKPNSEDSLNFSIIQDDDESYRCMISRDSRTASLKDMSGVVFDIRKTNPLDDFNQTFTVDFSEFFAWTKTAIQTIGSDGEFEFHSEYSQSAPSLTITSGAKDIISQAVIAGEQNNNNEDVTSIISSKALATTKAFSKMAGGEDIVSGYISSGAFALEAQSKDNNASVDRIVHILPASLNNTPHNEDPFESGRRNILKSDDISFIKEQVSSISSVVTTGESLLRIDTTQDGVVKFQVTDKEGTAKSVSFDYVIQDSTIDVSVPLNAFKNALKGFSKDDIIQISQAYDNDMSWIILSDEDNSEDDEDSNDDVKFITNEVAIRVIDDWKDR